jgi:hypothetical protein
MVEAKSTRATRAKVPRALNDSQRSSAPPAVAPDTRLELPPAALELAQEFCRREVWRESLLETDRVAR